MPRQQGYKTPGRAFGKCGIATVKVIRALQKSNRIAVPIRFSDYTGDLNKAYKQWQTRFSGIEHYLIHYMAFCDGMFLDFTARQFDSNAPYPAIYTATQTAAMWRRMIYDGQVWDSDGKQWFVNETSVAPSFRLLFTDYSLSL